VTDSQGYVHGHSDREHGRLFDQANALTELLHADTRYPAGSTVLEALATLKRVLRPGGTITAMVEGVKDRVLAAGLMDEAGWNRGIADLYRTTQPDGTFNYTFFKGVGIQPAR
jgi:hypothetical protein